MFFTASFWGAMMWCGVIIIIIIIIFFLPSVLRSWGSLKLTTKYKGGYDRQSVQSLLLLLLLLLLLYSR